MANYKLNDEKMFADVTDGIAIIINSETGIYYGMNGLATLVYEALVSGSSTEDVLEGLKALEGAPEDMEYRLKLYVDAMVEHGLFLEDAPNNAKVTFNPEIAKDDEYFIELKAYSDAQELLLADPIHEVKEETGWTPEKESIGYSKEETAKREEKAEDR